MEQKRLSFFAAHLCFQFEVFVVDAFCVRFVVIRERERSVKRSCQRYCYYCQRCQQQPAVGVGQSDDRLPLELSGRVTKPNHRVGPGSKPHLTCKITKPTFDKTRNNHALLKRFLFLPAESQHLLKVSANFPIKFVLLVQPNPWLSVSSCPDVV